MHRLLLIGLVSSLLGSDELNQKLQRLFDTPAFEEKRFGPARWVKNGAAFTTLEGSAIIEHETATGKRTTLVAAAALTPEGAKQPLPIDDYRWSPDGKKLLVFTNTRRVWRQNTRGDYWVLDRATSRLRQLGGQAPSSSLMFAKFSPNSEQVAYVRSHNLYVEELSTGQIRALTTDGGDTIINGTSDWVYEEELNLRDGYRWSPDGRSIAFWNFDTSGVEPYSLINHTDSLYPTILKIPYPKAGTRNSAVRIGVVGVESGAAASSPPVGCKFPATPASTISFA